MRNDNIIIKKASNGYTLNYNCGCYSETDECTCENFVFGDDAIGMSELLWQVQEIMGHDEGKYSKNRIYIYIANGECYDGEDKDIVCPHCLKEYKENG